MSDPYYITPISSSREILEKLKEGDLVECSLAFTKEHIRKLFESHGVYFKYCDNGSKWYSQYGLPVVKVTGVAENQMRSPKFFGNVINRENFFNRLRVGDLVRYSASYDVAQIKVIFESYNFSIEHCLSDSKEYKKFGGLLVKVANNAHNIDIKDTIKSTVFDPAMLDI